MNTREGVKTDLLKRTSSDTEGGEISRRAVCKYKLASFFHIGILKGRALKEKTKGLITQNYSVDSRRRF